MYLFGSVALGKDTPNSDVDIYVEMELDMLKRMQPSHILRSIVNREVDVVRHREGINNLLKSQIEQEAYESFNNRPISSNLLEHVQNFIYTIQQRTVMISCTSDFLMSPGNMEKLDAVCMQLMAIGECVEKLDKRVDGGQ